MALQVLQALHQLLGGVRKPQPGQLQANSEVQMPQNDGSLLALQKLAVLTGNPQTQRFNPNLYGAQPAGGFDQQAPQVGVNYHSLNYLASLGQPRTDTGAIAPGMVNVPWSSQQVPYSQSLTPPSWYGNKMNQGSGRSVAMRSQ